LGALKGEKTLLELARQFDGHANPGPGHAPLHDWVEADRTVEEPVAGGRGRRLRRRCDAKTLHAKIGQLALENDFLEGAPTVERIWRTIKYEEVHLRAYQSVQEARTSLGKYIEFYNRTRPHSSLKGKTPDQAYFHRLPETPAA
jgi:putative transposase